MPFYSGKLTGDFNGDTYDDIAVFYNYGGSHTKMWEYLGGSTGISSPVLAWDSTTWAWEAAKPTVGDFNGDGYDDIVAFYNYGNGLTKAWLFKGKSTGIDAPVEAWSSGTGNMEWKQLLPVSGDFNHDGKADIAGFYDYSGSQTKMWQFLGTTTGIAAPTLEWDSGVGGWTWSSTKPAVGDFDNDGYDDIGAFFSYPGSQTKLFKFAGSSTGVTAPTQVWDSGVGNMEWTSIKQISGDFDGNGYDDLAVFFTYGGTHAKIWAMYSSSTGIAAPVEAWNSTTWDWASAKATVGDFNHDGKADIAAFYWYAGTQTKIWAFYGSSSGIGPISLGWDSGAGNMDTSNVLIA
ncbi:MAG TPA: VCBS repeat-containing protein [Candidatus Saccharimonadales bacterium]|nr:VCBS repeat-containing protein [Candidatus Saccharimonadales bacterium]